MLTWLHRGQALDSSAEEKRGNVNLLLTEVFPEVPKEAQHFQSGVESSSGVIVTPSFFNIKHVAVQRGKNVIPFNVVEIFPKELNTWTKRLSIKPNKRLKAVLMFVFYPH